MSKPTALRRQDFAVFRSIPTRWSDNDMYGHVNNVVYYSWFDTAVNTYLIEQGVLDPISGQWVGLVVETQCNYFAPLSYPQTIEAGLRVGQVGRTSVRYEIGLFAPSAEVCAAQGHFVHVYVDKVSQKPIALPLPLARLVQHLSVAT